MKKLILIILLFLSFFTAKAQEYQFSQKYTHFISMDFEGNKSAWQDIDAIVYYNFQGENRVRMFLNNHIRTFNQISNAKEDKTESKYSFQEFEVMDIATGEVIVIQLFDDLKFGVRLFFDDLSSIQLVP